ncbi:MAG: hypothetical protein OK454_04685 [Thaumarchaeota archaeon]|nr:hypothetical protein [Nitrososphaerota archaeon]
MSIIDKSRNMRQKYPSTPVKIKVKARPAKRKDSITSDSSLDFSDDDGYSAVDDVSDSEDDDEEDVDAAEEEHIISHGLPRIAPSAAPRPLVEADEDKDGGVADEEEEEEEEEDEEEAGDEAVIEDDEVHDDEDVPETGNWDGVLSEMDESAASHYILDQDVANVERHVRFAGVPDSDTDSTTTDTTIGVDEYFPDIFVSQTSLDPAFRREIEEDPDESSGSTSFWDFHGNYEYSGAFAEDSDDDHHRRIRSIISEEDTPIGTPIPIASHIPTEISTPVVAAEEPQELDGYESEFVYRAQTTYSSGRSVLIAACASRR